MGAENPKKRFGEAAKLLDYGFMNYKITKTDPAGTIKGKIKIYKLVFYFTIVFLYIL
jgi:D-alanyl-D-alanine carboxypeptidase (penicillin-binding protein 5/6)